MARVIFWSAFGFVSYVYFGYPLLLLVWRLLARKPILKGPWKPSVSMVIAAHNERDNLGAKIRDCLALDYPKDKLEIVVSLDGPTDGTEYVARQYEPAGVRIVHSYEHQGKAEALNCGVAASHGEVIVFADARQRIHSLAIRELVANLNDPSVGAVSGEMILRDRGAQGEQDTLRPAGFYWKYDKWLRSMESDIHSSMGASGALYAIRRALFHPLPVGTVLDDVFVPMQIMLTGKRIVFEPSARVYDTIAGPEAEFGRKVRTLAGNYQLLSMMPELLIPWRNRAFVQFTSHKVGRLLVPYFLMILFLSNLFLLRGFYLMTFALQGAFYLLAFAGRLALGNQRSQPVTKPFLVTRS